MNTYIEQLRYLAKQVAEENISRNAIATTIHALAHNLEEEIKKGTVKAHFQVEEDDHGDKRLYCWINIGNLLPMNFGDQELAESVAAFEEDDDGVINWHDDLVRDLIEKGVEVQEFDFDTYFKENDGEFCVCMGETKTHIEGTFLSLTICEVCNKPKAPKGPFR